MNSASAAAGTDARSAAPIVAFVANWIVVLLFPAIVITVAVGLARTQLIFVTLPLLALLVAFPVLDRAGYYRWAHAVPLGVLLVPAVALLALSRLPSLAPALHAAPASWLIGIQVFRLGGAVWLVALASRELRKPYFTTSAGGLDVLVGGTAIPVALAVSTGMRLGLALAVAWNVVGLLDFAIAIGLARLSGGGPRDMLSQRTPTLVALSPAVLGIVAFGVPVAIVLHALSLYQLFG